MNYSVLWMRTEVLFSTILSFVANLQSKLDSYLSVCLGCLSVKHFTALIYNFYIVELFFLFCQSL